MAAPHDPLFHLNEHELLDHFEKLVARDRQTTVELLLAIAEIDERKLWAKQAFPSMFAVCMKRFHMSEQTTAKRLWAARTARRFPAILAMVARGELHLSAIQRLAGHLTDDNHVELLEHARYKSSREIEVLVAGLTPRPERPSRIRALAVPRVGDSPSASAPAGAVSDSGARRTPEPLQGEPPRISTARDGSTAPARSNAFQGHAARNCAAEPIVPQGADRTTRSPAGEPIVAPGPRRYRIEITVDERTHDKLRSLQDLLGRSATGRDPAAIVSRAIEVLLARTLTRKAGLTDQPRRRSEAATRDASRRPRGIPAAVRRQVWTRDCGRCCYVDDRGRRCDGTSNVEFHHKVAFARGGSHRADNIELRCAAHNQYQADLDFGPVFMAEKRGISA